MAEDKETLSSSNEAQDHAGLLFPYQLIDTRLLQISAELCELDEGEEPEPSVRITLLEPESPYAKELEVGLSIEIQYMEADGDLFNLSVMLQGLFVAIVEPETVDQDVLRRFVTRDSITLLWPYLREIADNITRRMRLPMPPLPIMDASRLVDATESTEDETSG